MTNEELLAKLKELTERRDAAKQAQQARCPSCGHCPTCGHTPWRLAPLQPYILRWEYVPFVQPSPPTNPGPTWTLTTTGGNVSTTGFSVTTSPDEMAAMHADGSLSYTAGLHCTSS